MKFGLSMYFVYLIDLQGNNVIIEQFETPRYFKRCMYVVYLQRIKTLLRTERSKHI